MTGRRARGRRSCHYCGAPATTRDHIVPRSRALYLGSRAAGNVVPACAPCNVAKSDYRSDCHCLACMSAWETYGPPGWRQLPVVALIAGERTPRLEEETA